MNAVDRSLVIIRPKAPFIKWANSCSADGREYTPSHFVEDCTAILIPTCDINLEARQYVNKIWDEIFRFELENWEENELLWPKERTQKTFWQWFSIEFHSFILDTVE